jgi:hypothetical protein
MDKKMEKEAIIDLKARRLSAMKARLTSETFLTVMEVAARWGVSRSVVEALPVEILPYVNMTPFSARANRRHHPVEVQAAEVRLGRWEKARAQGQGEEYLRSLRTEREGIDQEVLARALEVAA